MQDILGKEIEIGDRIAYGTTSAYMQIGTVIRLHFKEEAVRWSEDTITVKGDGNVRPGKLKNLREVLVINKLLEDEGNES